jgi:DNA polymerase elongation subunit (family B)
MDPVMREELKMTRATKQEILELFCAAKSVEQISAKLDIDVDLVKEVIQNLRTVRYTPARQLFGMN